MAGTRLPVRTVGFALALALAACPGNSAAAEFSAEATALPFPPDARELEFVAWAGDINYNSHSPLKSLAAFYLNEMVSFVELYDFGLPDYFILQLGSYPSLALSIPGVGIGGASAENAVGEMKVEAGRVRGTLEMPPEEILNRQFSFTATIDAVIITPNTRITGPGDPVERSDHPILADSPVPMPEGAEDVSRKGSNFRKTYSAVAVMPLADVASFYRKELARQGWKGADTQAAGDAMQFKNDTMELSVALKRQGGETAIEVVTRDVAAAKREGLLPEPGMGRLVLANGHNVGVLFTIGKTDYPLAAGHGAEDPRQALNYSVAPGTYEVVIKIPGQQQQTERIEITEGSTWGIVVLPTGGYMPMRMY